MAAPYIEDRPVALTLFGRPSSPGVARVRLWGRGERLARAAKGLGACWALAVATAFIPVAHFFLVPGFLLGGIGVAWRWSGQAATFEGARGACPACGRDGQYKARGMFRLPKETSCGGCGGRVILAEPGAGMEPGGATEDAG